MVRQRNAEAKHHHLVGEIVVDNCCVSGLEFEQARVSDSMLVDADKELCDG